MKKKKFREKTAGIINFVNLIKKLGNIKIKNLLTKSVFGSAI
jgi:hypothetical protein